MAARIEQGLGWALLLLLLIGGALGFNDRGIYWRLLLGIALGYIISRSGIGFAGIVPNTYRSKNPSMFLNVLLLCLLATIGTMPVVMFVPGEWQLLIHPINGGLLFGGLLFGFGMSLTSFCSMTILMKLATHFIDALIALVFFGLGIWFAFPLEDTPLVTQTWLQSSTIHQGVYFPDWFRTAGRGYIGGLIITAVLCIIFAIWTLWYCRQKISWHSIKQWFSLKKDEQADPSLSTYYRLFQAEWSLTLGAILLAVVCSVMMWTTHSGWQAASPYGIWFGKALIHLGVSPELVAGYAHKSISFFTEPLLSDAGSVQNIGTLAGAVIYFLTAGRFFKTFRSGLHIRWQDVPIYALGGIVMGVGTRLANGCNAGALFTPITNFSLSGWLVLIATMIGAFLCIRLKSYLKSSI